MLPFEVRIKEECFCSHFFKGIGVFEDDVAEGFQEGFVQVIEHWILDIDILDFVPFPFLL